MFEGSDADVVRSIERDIRAEIQSHLAMLEDECADEGREPGDARREAAHRFGDVDAVFRRCRRIRLREWTMNQRVNSLLLVLLAVAIGYLALTASTSLAENRQAVVDLQAQLAGIGDLLRQNRNSIDPATGMVAGAENPAPMEGTERERVVAPATRGVPKAVPTAAEYLEKFNSAWPLSRAVGVAKELGEHPIADVWRIMNEIYGHIDSADVRRILIAPLIDSHPQSALLFLRLAARDRTAENRAVAEDEISIYAFRDFDGDASRLEQWLATVSGRPAKQVFSACATEFVTRLAGVPQARIADELRFITRKTEKLATRLGVDLSAVLRSAGMLDLLETLVQSPDESTRVQAWNLARTSADVAFLKRHARPLLDDPRSLPPAIAREVYFALAQHKDPWVGEALREAMIATPPNRIGAFYGVARALAANEDPLSIPVMIGMIVADDSPQTIYGIGWFGLNKLTGVPYDDSHDGAWWSKWWKENQHRLPPRVRGMPIPEIQLAK